MTKQTRIAVTLSDGQMIDIYLDADGLTPEEEKRQAGGGLLSLYAVLCPSPRGDVSQYMDPPRLTAVDRLLSGMESRIKPQH